MGTRSRIAIRNENNTYDSIYCHWDGYPSHNGVILRDHYTETAKVRALIELGDISSLAPKIGTRHNFDKAPKDQVNAYGRDRGEDAPTERGTPTLEALAQLTQDCGGEWLYIWNGHGWSCAEGGIAFFGNPADKPPDLSGLESVNYWIEKEALANSPNT